MRIKIEISENEKKIIGITAVILAVIVYFINRRYLYILEAEFEGDQPLGVLLKRGFIFPVKTWIPMQDGFQKRIRLYGGKLKVIKMKDHYDILLNNKKIHAVYTDSWYQEYKKLPTGKISL